MQPVNTAVIDWAGRNECPACDTRYLGEQRCADCGVFCRKLGPGAPCPHCDEPVLLADLLLQLAGGEAVLP